MGKHWEKRVARTRAAMASVGATKTRKPRECPMSTEDVESYLRGFGLSAANARQIARTWIEDQSQAHQQGYSQGQEDAEYYNNS